MIKDKKLPENILNLLPQANNFLENYPKVVFAYLFGSLTKGKVNPLSDIDVALYLKKGTNFSREKMVILEELIDIFGTEEIDLVILNIAPLTLKARIVGNKKILVDKDPFLRHSFESLVLREYFDFSKKEEDIFKRRFSLGK
ncbi:nucleotidyltransferase domain-containing protein [Candidatus Atribacteria bacterium 1244-E10-H5-B2]|nr:MAG: nucleotidyltransferase domain-containing protein [Candidatus Atribacteria bacterium 1244-E10-H5-B2]